MTPSEQKENLIHTLKVLARYERDTVPAFAPAPAEFDPDEDELELEEAGSYLD